ncbi:MAG: hemerythrin domain-containing protein [Nitrospira sp.]|nr:hemerythrin domain-containing protein [Nitrospira sp.]
MNKEIAITVEQSTELLNMLQNDHGKVKELFEQFEQTADMEERGAIIRSALKELEVHAELEEKIIYPALRELLEDDGLITESLEEHHVVDLLIKELKGSHVKQDRRDAKFTVLAKNVKHHIKEEEESLFPEALVLDLDWEALSAKVEKKKAQLGSREPPSKRRHV